MKTDPAPGTRVRFGTFEADLSSAELHRDGLKVKIQELPFQVLVLLLERPGEVVTREDLRSRLWPADTFVDFEQGLNKAINKLREALGDDANNPRFVETLTRRGYRFIGPVEHIDSGSSVAGGEEFSERNPGPAPSRRWVMVALAGALLVVAVVAIVGWWRAVQNSAPTPAGSGEILPGPTVAFLPRISPKGNLIAYQALVDNLAQVAVTDPASGNWTVLSHERTHGPVFGNLCWSHDGSRIYFDRHSPSSSGVYSVPSLGGEERLVLANAESPELLPDGSLLVARVDPDRRNRIYHYWPDTGRLQALEAWIATPPIGVIRAFRGQEAVFWGAATGKSDDFPHLYLLNTLTGSTRRLAPELPIVQLSEYFPLAVTPDGQSVLTDIPAGDLHQIVAIPRSGKHPVRTLLTLTSVPWGLDAAPDGSVYVDQLDRPLQILRVPRSGGTPEVLTSIAAYHFPSWTSPTEFPDGRLLVPAAISGRPRLLLGKPGGSFAPLLQTNEESTPPMVRIGDDEVAFLAGTPPARGLAIASVRDGHIIRRFKATEDKPIDTVAALPDRKTLYYVSSGNVWSIPSQGGSPRKVCAGDSMAVDPNGRYLIVHLYEQGGVLLERVGISGGAAQRLQIKSDLSVSPLLLGPNAINEEGRLLVGLHRTDSWFLGLGILDLATGRLARVPLDYTGDILTPGWARDGAILTTALPMEAHIWRFRPTK